MHAKTPLAAAQPVAAAVPPTVPSLVAEVTRLVDSVDRHGAAAERRRCPLYRAALARVFKAALDAEWRLAEQAKQIARLQRMAVTDDLTGLLNRRGFEAQLHKVLAAGRRYGEWGVLIYVDLDGFKPINDTYGHAAGDEVLRQVARLLEANVRETDHLGRLGGDEFAVLLGRTPLEDGLAKAQALDRTLNRTVLTWRGTLIALGASLGVQPFGPDHDGARLLAEADAAMFEAKRQRAEPAGLRARA